MVFILLEILISIRIKIKELDGDGYFRSCGECNPCFEQRTVRQRHNFE